MLFIYKVVLELYLVTNMWEPLGGALDSLFDCMGDAGRDAAVRHLQRRMRARWY